MLGLCGVGIEELMASNLYSEENLNNNKCQVTLYVIVMWHNKIEISQPHMPVPAKHQVVLLR